MAKQVKQVKQGDVDSITRRAWFRLVIAQQAMEGALSYEGKVAAREMAAQATDGWREVCRRNGWIGANGRTLAVHLIP